MPGFPCAGKSHRACQERGSIHRSCLTVERVGVRVWAPEAAAIRGGGRPAGAGGSRGLSTRIVAAVSSLAADSARSRLWRRAATIRLEGCGFSRLRPPLFPHMDRRHRQRASHDACPPFHGCLPTLRGVGFDVAARVYSCGARARMIGPLAGRLSRAADWPASFARPAHPRPANDASLAQPGTNRGHGPPWPPLLGRRLL